MVESRNGPCRKISDTLGFVGRFPTLYFVGILPTQRVCVLEDDLFFGRYDPVV